MAEASVPAMPPADKVTVVLSTFNGSAFLQEQLNSLYAQTHPVTRILARDDGSTDDTRSILARAQADGRLEVLADHNHLGAAGSFFALLKLAAAGDAELVAFCDQDDVWQPEKVARAVAALSAVRNSRAAMYCSRLEIVDVALARIGETALPRKIGFGNALVESVCVGCTIVLNRQAIELVCRNPPANALVHDWWCYLVLSCFGEIIFEPSSHIKYRQHAGNAFGATRGKLDRAKRSLRRFAGGGAGRHWQSGQAAVFMATFGDHLPRARHDILRRFIEAKTAWRQRLSLAWSGDIWRQSRIDDLVMRLLILINRY